MHKEKVIRTLFVFCAALLALAAVSLALASTPLNNNGFNGNFHAQSGVNGVVPDGWTAINLAGNPQWIDTETWCNCGYPEKTEGSNAVVLVSEHIEDCCNGNADGWPFDAVLYQQVHGMNIGAQYSFATAMLTFCGGTAPVSSCWHFNNYTATKQVGFDPLGGTDPLASSVIWSTPNGDDHAWRDMTVAGRAQATTVTVFIRVKWPYTFHGMWAVLDGAYLALAPIGTLNANAGNGAGPITLTWSAQVSQDVSDYYDGIELAYDVQMRDGSAAWTNLLTGTKDTHALYIGSIGHTYQFRVLPFLGYPPDNHRLDGLLTDSVTVTIGDLVAPASAVASLPAVQVNPAFMVQWAGSDNISPPGALHFDVQYRDGPTGVWTNWKTDSTTTSASFTGQAGHQYNFRSRAQDEANNTEAYPSAPDAATTVALAVSGTVLNMREQPVPLAIVNFNPAAVGSAASGLDGQYAAHVLNTDTYAFHPSRAGFGILPSMDVMVTANNAVAPAAYLPPLNDLVANGQFETSNLNGWTLSGQNTPSLNGQQHSGNKAVELGGAPNDESSLAQTIVLAADMQSATLAYMVRTPLGGTDPFTVTVTSDQSTSVTTPSISGNGWSHQWLDLTPFAGQSITVTFAFLPSNANATLLLDEIEAGEADGVTVYQTYLPSVTR